MGMKAPRPDPENPYQPDKPSAKDVALRVGGLLAAPVVVPAARLWGVLDRYVFGTALGKGLLVVVFAAALPAVDPAKVAGYADLANRLLDAITIDAEGAE